jgi:hypothetical protein
MKNSKKIGKFLLQYKGLALSLMFCVFIVQGSVGQLQKCLNEMSLDSNYFSIKAQVEDYLDSLKNTLDSSEFYAGGGEYKELKFFESIWEPRVTPDGNFSYYYNNMEDYYNNYSDDYSYITNDNWIELGPNKTQTVSYKGIGPAEFISFHDGGNADSTRYMLTSSCLGGLFYSDNFGESWKNGGSDNWTQSGCSWAIFHPNNHNIWYAASSGDGESTESLWIGKNGGVYRTMNEGSSWTQIANYEDLNGIWTRIFKLIIDPINPQILYVSTSSGIFKTTNCEVTNPTWTQLLTGFVWDFEMNPEDNSILYASDFINGYWKIMISYDNGANWNEMAVQPAVLNNNNIRQQYFTIEVSKAKPDYIYCLVKNSSAHELFYFDIENGTNWISIGTHSTNSHGSGHGFGVEQVINGEDLLTSYGVWLKHFNINTGAGSSYNTVHCDVEDIIYHPYNEDEVWACTHGGVEKSTDDGVHWQAKYDGLGVSQVEAFASSYLDPQYVIVGAYHDGIQITQSDYVPNWQPIWKWVENTYYDGQMPLIDNINPNNMWASGQKGIWWFSSNYFAAEPTQISSFYTTFFQSVGALNKENPEIFFRNKYISINREEVYRSDNYGLSGGTNEYISDFDALFTSGNNINILGMHTPYNDGDYLLVNLSDEDANDVRTWHLFRTTNAIAAANQVTWIDLPIPRTTNVWFSDAEFDPNDPDIVYVVYSKSSSDVSVIGIIYKVDYSNPSNPVVTDITKNLPNTVTATNCLVTENGSNGGLFLATEYGVFYTNNALLSNTGDEWQMVGTNLPHVRIKGIDINYVSNTLRVATWGRGVWELPLPCIYNEDPMIISSNTTWDSYMRIDRSIEVNSGVTLTLAENARILMPTDAKIIVHRGGELVINGGTLTAACSDGLWQGVEVWGTTNLSQSTAGAQGKIIIENGGTIENAVTAVFLSKSNGSGGYTAGYEGGIIQTNDAHFINNRTGVRFFPYRNVVSGLEMDNLSYFHNSEFLTDAELADESVPEKFIYLDGIKGINVKGCSFSNSRSEEEASMSDRGIGIFSYDASFTVSWFCESSYPCEDPDSSTFTNLNYGIQAFDVYSTRTFEVNHSGFYNNLTGIYLKFINYAEIIFNDFELYNVSLFHGPNDIFGGLYLDECTGYTVEENNFFNDDQYDPQNEIRSIGITVNESRDNLNMIYRNTFNRLHMGILAQNRNRGLYTYTGLKIECNVCTNNEGDFAVTGDGSSLNQGISRYQGAYVYNDITAPAGNLFTHAGNNDPYSDFNNTISSSRIYYFQHTGSSQNLWELVYFPTQTITKYEYGTYPGYEESCPSNYSLGGGNKKSSPIVMGEEELKSRMNFMEEHRDSTANALSLWIDAGNTPQLNYVVESSTVPQSLDIFDELISDSPYLSDSVLSTSIEKQDVLINAMIRDIMVANPHGVKREELVEALKQRVPSVPEYMMAEIMAGLDSLSVKELREGEIAWYEQERDLAFNKLISIYLKDTLLSSAEDSIISLISNHGNLNSHYYLATRYLEQGDAFSAFLILNSVPNLFVLNSEQEIEHQDFLTLMTMINNLREQGKPLDSLNVSSRQILYQIAEHNSRPAAMAQNILQKIDTAIYHEVYILPTSGPVVRKYEAENPNINNGLEQGNVFRVYPNPSHDYFILEYYFEIVPNQASYSVSDQMGRIIEEGPIEGRQDQLIRRTTSYSQGIYTIKLIINGKVEKALKLNVIK